MEGRKYMLLQLANIAVGGISAATARRHERKLRQQMMPGRDATMDGCLTSKMSMEGWWMVHTTVRPVFTVLRTAQE